MLKPVTEEELTRYNDGIKKLVELMQQHPNLPVIPMVDSEVMQDEGYAWWSAKFGASPYISKICANYERLVCWDENTEIESTFEELDLDYEECGITDDMTYEETHKIMERELNKFDWLLCIVIPVDIPDPIVPEVKHEQPVGTMFERLQERVRKYAAQTH